MSNKIANVVFRVEEPQRLAKWYKEVLGMSVKMEKDSICVCEYDGNGSGVKLIKELNFPKSSYKSERNNVYWKIGLALADVNLATEKLRNHGCSVSNPAQFLDIGFLCHLADPDGFGIELLQHTFEKNFVKNPTLPHEDKPIGN